MVWLKWYCFELEFCGAVDDRTIREESRSSGQGFCHRMEGGSVSRLTCSGNCSHSYLVFLDTLMDYDDNDSQSQNLHLAGEGNNKFPPVLRSYDLPRFDFDDNLRGHLRFDSLVETEVFLGIESSEDNQWIEEFSRGSTGIAFSSSAAEPCLISRRTNVWSEAASSESVEMLLKSVGQDETTLGQTISKDSDACDELGCMIKPMDPSLKHRYSSLSKVGDDIQPALHTGEIPGKCVDNQLVKDASQTHEGDPSVHGALEDPNSKNTDIPATERDESKDSKHIVVNENLVEASVDQSLDDSGQEDKFASGSEVNTIIPSVQSTCMTSVLIDDEDSTHLKNDIIDKNVDSLERENVGLSPELHIGGKNLVDDTVACVTSHVQKHSASDMQSREEEHATGNSTANMSEPSGRILEGNSDLHMVEECSKRAGVEILLQTSKSEDIVLSEGKLHDTSSMPIGSDITLMEHENEVSDTDTIICMSLESKVNSTMKLASDAIEKKDLLESDYHPDKKISSSKSEKSLLLAEDGKGSKDEGEDSHDTLVAGPTKLASKQNTNLPSDCSSADCFDDRSPLVTKGVDSSSFGAGGRVNELASNLQPDVPVSSMLVDCVLLPSDKGMPANTVLDKKEVQVPSSEASFSVVKTSEMTTEKGASCETGEQFSCKIVDQSLLMKNTTTLEGENGDQTLCGVTLEVGKDMHSSSIVSDSTVRKTDGDKALVISKVSTDSAGGASTQLNKTLMSSVPSTSMEASHNTDQNHHKDNDSKLVSEEISGRVAVHQVDAGTGQLVQSNEMQHYGHIEGGNMKPFGVLSTSVSSLPDLNTSASSSAVFQQPFTDLQQVQLRAQIFVYGALIQGTVPDEAYMISAFGGPDGGRTIWENAWRAGTERVHGKKSLLVSPETPLQSHIGAKTSDQSIKQNTLQSKVTSSPASRSTSKGTPTTSIVNPIIPLSSPLWSIRTPSGDALQPTGFPRGAVMDYQLAISPLHPPATRNLIGHNSSWMSQSPFRGPWTPQTSAFDGNACFPVRPITEAVNSNPAIASVPHCSSMKQVSAVPVVQSGSPANIFAGTPLLDTKKATLTPGQHSADPKPRKRKKSTVSEEPGQSIPHFQSESPLATVVVSQASKPAAITIPATNISKSTDKFITSVSGNHLKKGDQESDQRASLSEETLTLVSSGYRNSTPNNAISDSGKRLSEATPASILGAEDAAASSNSVIVVAREVARRRVEAASAAAKQAENMDAIVKAAELAAEAVSQAGKIVAMGEPFSLAELVEAGPEAYWKVPQASPEPDGAIREQINIGGSMEAPGSSVGHLKEVPVDKREKQDNHRKSPTHREMTRVSMEDRSRLTDGGLAPVATSEKDKKGQKRRKASDVAKTKGVASESEIGFESPLMITQTDREKAGETSKDNNIREGSHVELPDGNVLVIYTHIIELILYLICFQFYYLMPVLRDGGGSRVAWFLADILNLNNGKAYVCYNELRQEDGDRLKEWVEVEGDRAPRIRCARPSTAMSFEGTRKRRRAAMADYNWSVGDRVDAWMQNSWWEGVVIEKSKKDETSFTVHFPAQGETSGVKAWLLRSSLMWKKGSWVEWSSSVDNNESSREGDTPQEKRQRLGSPVVEAKGKDKLSKNVYIKESGKPDDTKLLDLSANKEIFNIGKSTRDESKPDSLRMIHTGLKKKGSGVVFGVPKPGKKQKFMEVSKHYVADQSSKTHETSDSAKFTKYLMPQGSEPRGTKNKIEPKLMAVSKPKILKSGKLPSVSSRSIPQKNYLPNTMISEPDSVVASDVSKLEDSASHAENVSGKPNLMEFRSFSSSDGAAEGPVLFSSVAVSSDASLKKTPASNAKSERINKGKFAPSGGKLAKIEENVFNDDTTKTSSEGVEPRRSNRRIQPTSRLLEGLQSSLAISKIPSVSFDKSHKSQSRSMRGET
ncbi:hypothetical protein GOBAR_DD20634 [Gossypium barbadense]|nr:hypothetical protein GOBAR_DD20634 [Gossypium barbadense]